MAGEVRRGSFDLVVRGGDLLEAAGRSAPELIGEAAAAVGLLVRPRPVPTAGVPTLVTG